MSQPTANNNWLYEIKSKHSLFSLDLKEIWRYRDLFVLFVKRDIVTVYKQTILGPLWFLIQPLFTSVIFTLIFNQVAGIDNGAIPNFLFNLAGVTLWSYFKDALTATSNTFTANQALFGKVFFPRIIAPASKVISGLLKYFIQVGIFIAFYIYYVLEGVNTTPTIHILWLPVLLFCIILIAMGLGMILSAATTKYRDLTILITFGLSLLMYLSCVMYSMDTAREKLGEYYFLVKWNPIAHIVESYRSIMFDSIEFHYLGLIIGTMSGIILFSVGLLIFNKTEKTFIDTV